MLDGTGSAVMHMIYVSQFREMALYEAHAPHFPRKYNLLEAIASSSFKINKKKSNVTYW